MTPRSRRPSQGRGPVRALGTDLWFRCERDGSYVIGFTDVAQRRNGSFAYYRGPEVGRRYDPTEYAMTFESDKCVWHLSLPVEGTVIETNASLLADPRAINRDPYGAGWLYRMRPTRSGALERIAEQSARRSERAR